MECAERTCSGSLFQARGPAAMNALSPNDRCVLGTSKVNVSADRRPVLRPIENHMTIDIESNVQHSTKALHRLVFYGKTHLAKLCPTFESTYQINAEGCLKR